jgi:hypothetical protein
MAARAPIAERALTGCHGRTIVLRFFSTPIAPTLTSVRHLYRTEARVEAIAVEHDQCLFRVECETVLQDTEEAVERTLAVAVRLARGGWEHGQTYRLPALPPPPPPARPLDLHRHRHVAGRAGRSK